ncbi:putative integral membrane protein (TIGR02327 family) [Streptohalobacillus salinus]|uniref:Putative integral membrane protein (TIGR02327 family) n=1 Tax=Streptohalobacillus salinus TaxID=621096 RepID=A0A2V3WFM8_9BACI|nr:DUF1146 family protein [Streptohalobacillus salinus]PXW92040.1 putative integral membrane protein (TIGR02327 family) [Streptohalobacillus salinus]
MFQEVGTQAIVNIISHFIFIIFTWRALQSLRVDQLIKKHKVAEARLLMVFLTITIGSTVSHFFIDLMQWFQQLGYLF